MGAAGVHVECALQADGRFEVRSGEATGGALEAGGAGTSTSAADAQQLQLLLQLRLSFDDEVDFLCKQTDTNQ